MARDRQSGSVLVLAMLMTLVILGVGLTAMWMATSATKVTGNITRRQEALNAAEAGIERARWILTQNITDWNTLLDGTDCGSTLDPEKGRLLCDGAVTLQNAKLIDTSLQTASKTTASSQLNYTVYIRNDDDEAAAAPTGQEQVDKDKRVLVRSEGRGRDGLSYVAVEVVYNAAWLQDVHVKGYQSEGMGRGGSGVKRSF